MNLFEAIEEMLSELQKLDMLCVKELAECGTTCKECAK